MIRIVSEGGAGRGTKLIDTETGKDITDMLGVELGVTVDIGDAVTAQCTLSMVEVNVTAVQTDFLAKHPISKDYQPVAAIVFRDGWRIDFLEDGAPRVRQQTPDR